jgi:peptidyl-prolyl cis-trans isomerase SurA
MKTFVSIIFAVLLSMVPLFAVAETVSRVAVLVNDEPITSYDIAKEQATMEKGLGSKPLDAAGKAQLREAVLGSLINKKLIEQKVRELEIRVGDEEVRQAIEDVKRANNISEQDLRAALLAQGISYELYTAQVKEQLERLRLVSMEVRSKVQVSDAELKEYFAAHADKFQVDEAFRARQIFLAVPKEADLPRVTAQAEKILKEAKSGADFAALAAKYSTDSSAKEGGDLGYLKKGEILPEFEAALQQLKPGEISGLIRTAAGIHLLKLEEYRPGKRQDFESARRDVEDQLYKSKSEERFNKWLQELRSNASIEIKAEL